MGTKQGKTSRFTERISICLTPDQWRKVEAYRKKAQAADPTRHYSYGDLMRLALEKFLSA